METLLRFLRTQCAELALPDMGSHMQAFFNKFFKRKKYGPMAIWVHDTETNTPRSDELWQGCNELSNQKTRNCNSHTSHHRRIRYGIGPTGTRKK